MDIIIKQLLKNRFKIRKYVEKIFIEFIENDVDITEIINNVKDNLDKLDKVLV